jgi:hypothetical protein
MMRREGTATRLARLVLGAGLGGVLVGCILDLQPLASCGDGIVDEDAREECDPGDAQSGPCDPATCLRLIPTCGNGKLDTGEACDLSDFGNKDCPSGKGYLSCTADCQLDQSTCDTCGDGKVDPNEECDPKFVQPGGDFNKPITCAGLTTYPLKPYTTGVVSACTDKCMWYRGPCGYCGDNEADPPTRVDLNYPEDRTEDEYCDGEDAPHDRLRAYCDDNCPISGLECKPTCLNDCSNFDLSPVTAEKLECCLATNEDCPAAGDPAPCCAAYAMDLPDKFDAATACTDRAIWVDGMPNFKSVCK